VSTIEVRELSRRFGRVEALRELSFAVEEGEIFGFLGPNGAGKTTTTRLLMGLIRPSAGDVRVFGRDAWRSSPAIRAGIGFIPGELHLYEKMTGRQMLAFLASYRAAGALDRARELAGQLDLDLHRRVRDLSKGNRQKLAVVQALMHDPPLLVLDEPTSGLDPLVQAAVLELLAGERDRGKTVFFSSHLLHEVEQIADRVAVIRDGRLVVVEEIAHLREKRERRMELTLREPVPPGRFADLPGVRLLASHDDGRRLELAVHGDLQPLLRCLASLPVADLVYPPADLESVFMHYFEAPAGPAGEEPA
jgi:ABC-2 type transport system ATP-binding protein